jgi:2-dehydropantoate 2-reductase
MKKILVFGAGVIGSLYAAKFALSGQNVTVLARNKRLQELEFKGLLISENGKNTISANVKIISELKADDVYDYIFVILRKDQVRDALPVLSKNRSKNFVFMVNTPNGYSEWTERIGIERIIPAFPGAGGKIQNGIVNYTLTSRFIQPTTIGEISGNMSVRLLELKKMLQKAGFPTSISKNMDSWQKSHVAMVCSLAYGIYFDGGNNYTFSKNKVAINQMNKSLKETFWFLKHSGIGIEPAKLNFFRILPISIMNLIIPIVFNTKWAETVISNHALSARQELEMLYNDFINLAEENERNLKELKTLGNIIVTI